MVACVDEGAPPPADLRLAWLCEQWSTLPESGGMYEQDAKVIGRMTSLKNTYHALTRLRNAHGDQIHSLTDNDRYILKSLVDMGLIFT